MVLCSFFFQFSQQGKCFYCEWLLFGSWGVCFYSRMCFCHQTTTWRLFPLPYINLVVGRDRHIRMVKISTCCWTSLLSTPHCNLRLHVTTSDCTLQLASCIRKSQNHASMISQSLKVFWGKSMFQQVRSCWLKLTLCILSTSSRKHFSIWGALYYCCYHFQFLIVSLSLICLLMNTTQISKPF